MKHLHALLLLTVMTASGLAAAGPDSTYRAPRAHDGHPDLQGVWNFASGVPLQRRAAFGDRTVMTKEEFDKQRAAPLSALGAAAKFAPVENVGFDWIDFSLHVDDLRTLLIAHPDNWDRDTSSSKSPWTTVADSVRPRRMASSLAAATYAADASATTASIIPRSSNSKVSGPTPPPMSSRDP